MNEHADIVSVGFTGTQHGMTSGQEASVTQLLRVFQGDDFHHGGCIGSDVQAALIASGQGYRTIRHPGDTPEKQDTRYIDDVVDVVAPNLERNHYIVDITSVLIATPRQHHELLRSGTWATIRYARKKGGPLYVVLPDGLVT